MKTLAFSLSAFLFTLFTSAPSNAQPAARCNQALDSRLDQINPEVHEFFPASAFDLTQGYFRNAIKLSVQTVAGKELSEEKAYERFLPKHWDDKPFPRISWYQIGYDHAAGRSSSYLVLDFKRGKKAKRAVVLHEVDYSQPGFKQTLICAE